MLPHDRVDLQLLRILILAGFSWELLHERSCAFCLARERQLLGERHRGPKVTAAADPTYDRAPRCSRLEGRIGMRIPRPRLGISRSATAVLSRYVRAASHNARAKSGGSVPRPNRRHSYSGGSGMESSA
jgi:hypothetical protein